MNRKATQSVIALTDGPADVALADVVERQHELGAVLQAYNDVTERLRLSHEKLSDQVRRLRAEVEEKDLLLQRQEHLAVLGEMAAAVAHEIRNPLGSILLYTTMLERGLSDRPRDLELVNKALAGVRTLEGVVSDILTFAGQRRTRPSRYEAFDADRIVQEVADHLRTLAGQKGVQLIAHISHPHRPAMGDEIQVRRAIGNLVRNAVEACSAGGHVWIETEIRAQPDRGEHFVVRVSDDGPGIPTEDLQRIFEPMFSTKACGTGLGLAITRQSITAQGGTISVRNRPEGGAEFTVVLPMHEQAGRGETAPVARKETQANGSRLTMLTNLNGCKTTAHNPLTQVENNRWPVSV